MEEVLGGTSQLGAKFVASLGGGEGGEGLPEGLDRVEALEG